MGRLIIKSIVKKIKIGTDANMAFHKFLNEFNQWWPKEYTWSQDKLKDIWIDGKENRLCTEIGPYGFRCDWGRVIKLIENKKIEIKWQINSKREPVPDPNKASDVKVKFVSNEDTTTIELEHLNFENHGNGAKDYRKWWIQNKDGTIFWAAIRDIARKNKEWIYQAAASPASACACGWMFTWFKRCEVL